MIQNWAKPFSAVVCFFGLVVVLCLLGACEKERPREPVVPDYLEPMIHQVTQRRYVNLQSAIDYIDSMRQHSGIQGVEPSFHYYWLYYDTYNRHGVKDSAFKYVDSMLYVIRKADRMDKYYNRYIQALYNKADLLMDVKRYKEAYPLYYQALEYANKYHDTCAGGYYHMKLGIELYRGEFYGDAGNYFKKAIEEMHRCNSDYEYFIRQQQLMNNVGLCYMKMQHYDSAVLFFERALQTLSRSRKNWPVSKHIGLDVSSAVIQGNLAEAYVALGDTFRARKLYVQSISVNQQKEGDYIDALYTRIKLAQLELLGGNKSAFTAMMDTVKSINDTVLNNSVLARWHKAMWKYYDTYQEPGKAYQHLLKYKQLTEQLVPMRDRLSMMDLDNQVNLLKNQYEINLLKEKDHTNRLYIVVAFVVCVLMAVIGFLVSQNLRKSKMHIRQVNEQRTQLEATLAELEHATNEKDRILKAVSHDMRSPINSTLALLDIYAVTNTGQTPEQLEYLHLMKKSGEQALNLTKDLLEVATLNNENLVKSPEDVTALFEERIRLLQFKATEKGQTLSFSAPDNHITANVNAEKILRVLTNLVTNAIKFSPVNGEIYVELRREGEFLRITVKDNGIGIPEKMKKSVFDVFSEAKRYGTSGEQPFGLGLSISKQIVEAHGGHIWLESEEGRGTTVFVDIPV